MSAAETVANIEELLKQILVRVPALSLLRFKSVSKHWLSLISSPDFSRLHTLLNHRKVSAIFNESFNSIPLGNREIPLACKALTTCVPHGSKLKILQSCNGLFLCHIPLSRKQTQHHPVYVVNPTTNQYRALSSPSVTKHGTDAFVRYALAFDPSESPHYKLVCVANWRYYRNGGHHGIDVYSSETGGWKHLETPFFPSPSDEGRHHDFIQRAMHFDYRSREGGVYCDDAVHWIRDGWSVGSLSFCSFGDGRQEFAREEADVLHYFDMRKERLVVVSDTPPLSSVVRNIPLKINDYGSKSPTMWPKLSQRYFGECGGRLQLIETYKHCMTQFDVMEMGRDYSSWFVKYHVDLNPLLAPLPGLDGNVFAVLCLSQEEETDTGVEDSSTDVLLHMPGKIISYNLRNKTFKAIVELASEELFLRIDDHRMREDATFPYMETLVLL